MGFLVRCRVEDCTIFAFTKTSDFDPSRVSLATADMKSVETELGVDTWDFSYLSCLGYSGGLVVSEGAVSLLRSQPGVAWLGEFFDSDGARRFVVQVMTQLDLLDRERSVPSGYGPNGFSGIHLIERADEIAGCSLFLLPPPNHFWLLCSAAWREAYEALGLTGLEFEIAKVG